MTAYDQALAEALKRLEKCYAVSSYGRPILLLLYNCGNFATAVDAIQPCQKLACNFADGV